MAMEKINLIVFVVVAAGQPLWNVVTDLADGKADSGFAGGRDFRVGGDDNRPYADVGPGFGECSGGA
jgi:hypothetical protein